jgi:outer membrane murein-binding lipoprotein Lpp
MGVEHGGTPSEDGKVHLKQVDHIDASPGRHTPVTEPAVEQTAEGAGAVPIEVFNRMAELERQLQETQAKLAKLEEQRQKARDRSRRWREAHPDEARAQTRARVAAYRARKRQAGGS